MPERLRMQRVKGWRKPEGAVVVGRPTRGEIALPKARPSLDEIRRELGGKDLLCWCALEGPRHADVLLELANS